MANTQGFSDCATSEMSPRIGLVGPTLPYRGGIAQYTTMLHRSLSLRSRLLTVSFKRQYPNWLYPGKYDIDPGYSGHQEPGVSYVIDSLNPVTWLKAYQSLVSHSACAVIIPWWTVFWTPCFGLIANYLKKNDIKVIFLCHNVIEHETAFWREMLIRKVFSKGNIFLVHTNNDANKLMNLQSKARIVVHPHPVYNQFPPAKKSLHRRASLELLFFGFVRRYKGLDILLEALNLLKNEDVFLTVAGEWWHKDKALRKKIEAKDLQEKIEVIDCYITEEKTSELFTRADVVVLPYRSASGSGVIPLAYHYSKPVITTSVGGLDEVVDNDVSGRVVRPEDPHALAEVIREFLYAPSINMEQGIEKVARHMTWDGLSNCILRLVNT
jgi:glycosyltransferase involved in cell wall biosynthesis